MWERKGRLERIKNILHPILARTGLSWRVREQIIMEKWKNIIGTQIARNTEVAKFRGGILYIKVSNSIWMQQLQFLKEMIMEKFKEEMRDIYIADIRFFLGEFQVSTENYFQATKAEGAKQGTTREAEFRAIISKEVAEELAQVKDPEIKELLFSLYTKKRAIHPGKG